MAKNNQTPEIRFKGFTCLPAGRLTLGKWYVYALECDDGSLYKGKTNDLIKRIYEHISGHGAEHTKKHKPVRLVYLEIFDTEKEAIDKEHYLKSGSGREWLKNNLTNYKPFDYTKQDPLQADPWEQRKLKDIASSFEYGLNAAAKEFDGVNKYLRITDIDDVSHAFRDDDLTSPDTDLSVADNYRLREGDVLFARTGASVGKSFIYRENDGLAYFAGFLIRARIKPEYSAEFVFQNTLSSQYEKYIQITSQRSGQPGVNAQEYGEYSFLMPTYLEQKKIGSFLYKLDNLITLHQRKLEKLQNIKKSMLEKMFV